MCTGEHLGQCRVPPSCSGNVVFVHELTSDGVITSNPHTSQVKCLSVMCNSSNVCGWKPHILKIMATLCTSKSTWDEGLILKIWTRGLLFWTVQRWILLSLPITVKAAVNMSAKAHRLEGRCILVIRSKSISDVSNKWYVCFLERPDAPTDKWILINIRVSWFQLQPHWSSWSVQVKVTQNLKISLAAVN